MPHGLPGARFPAVLRSAPACWQLPLCQPQGGALGPSGRWCLRELALSVQLEPEASKDSPSRNCRGMHSPTWSQLGELRRTGNSQTLFFLSPRWRGVAGSPRSEQPGPHPPRGPETNSEPYSPVWSLPLETDRWHIHAHGVRFPGGGIPGCLLHQPHC